VRDACLDRRAQDLDALAGLLESADEKLVERSVLAVESLPAAAECMNAARSLTEPMPAGEARTRVEALAPKVSQVRALRLAGKPKETLALADQLLPDVRAAGWRPLLAELLVEDANGLERAGKADEARPRYTEALQLALAANDPARGFAAAVGLCALDGTNSQRFQAAEVWGQVAESLIEPAGLRGTVEALRLVNARGVLALRNQSHAQAAKIFDQLVKQLEALGQLHTVNGARAMQNLGAALRESGQGDLGLDLTKRSLAIMEEVLAPAHPDVATAYNNLGSVLADLKRYDEAEGYYRKCVALREQLYGADAAPLATPHYNLGELAFRRGDGATALTEYGRSRELVEKSRGPDDDDAWDSRMGEGLALELLGRHQQALEVLERVLPEIEKRKLPEWNIAQARLGIATALHALGRDPARVKTLAGEVATLQGDRFADQRVQAEALLR
jgi:tetratricopeptide (TPR) repeat protein